MSSRHRISTSRPTPARPSNAASGSSRNVQRDIPLPPYRKPTHPLTEAAQQSLQSIYSNREAQSLKKLNAQAVEFITLTAGEINDHLRDREERIARRRKKWEQGIRVEEQDRGEQELRALQEKVDAMTADLEKGMRDAIDNSAATDRIEETMTWLAGNAARNMQDERATQSQTQGPTPGPTPLNRVALTGLSEMFNDRMDDKNTEYLSFSHSARYAKNNDYVGFRSMVHDAKYKDSGPQLPHPDTWFTEEGSPSLGVPIVQQNAEDDDDVVVDKVNIDIKCPLTLLDFKVPYTSKLCPHTFEKVAIHEMIRHSDGPKKDGKRAVQCPVHGCNKLLTMDDLHENAVLTRKIRRIQKAKAQDFGGEDQEAEESESDDEVAAQRLSRTPQQPPQSSIVVDLGDSPPPESDDET